MCCLIALTRSGKNIINKLKTGIKEIQGKSISIPETQIIFLQWMTQTRVNTIKTCENNLLISVILVNHNFSPSNVIVEFLRCLRELWTNLNKLTTIASKRGSKNQKCREYSYMLHWEHLRRPVAILLTSDLLVTVQQQLNN